MNQFKSQIESILRPYPPLFKLGSKIYHRLNSSFKTLSPGTPQALCRAMELAKLNAGSNHVGDYYEFGLFRGYTFLEAFKHSETLGLDTMNFYGFDSFQGLPAPKDETDAIDNRFFEGQFACSLEEIQSNLIKNGMPDGKAKLVEGYYEESLNEITRKQHPFGKAAVVLFDCDYYSSTKLALNWMTPYLRHQTVLLFDDWNSYGSSDELGQQKALIEFLRINPQLNVEPLWEFSNNGQAFIVVDAHLN